MFSLACFMLECEKMCDKIVINELLMVIQNKMDIMDEKMLVNLCNLHNTEQDVESAKATLTFYCGEHSVTTRRSGDGKKVKHLSDIIEMFRMTEPDYFPYFVAKDLGKLPSVTFDYINVVSVMKDISFLKCEL